MQGDDRHWSSSESGRLCEGIHSRLWRWCK